MADQGYVPILPYTNLYLLTVAYRLTQDDFRRLLQTPRPHASQSTNADADIQPKQIHNNQATAATR
jgi:hypothetical protein